VTKKTNLFYSLIVVILFVVMAAVFNLSGARRITLNLFAPLQSTTSFLWQSTIKVPASVIGVWGLGRENAHLKTQLTALEIKISLLQAVAAENKRLNDALNFVVANRYGFDLLPVEVIGRQDNLLIINKGRSAGVAVDMPALVKDGLVGRIVEVANNSAKVLLIIDPVSSVAAAVQKSRDQGIIVGVTARSLKLKYLVRGENIRLGDLVVTSSTSLIFPAGVPIGIVTKIHKNVSELFYEVDVAPTADFSRLEEIYLIK